MGPRRTPRRQKARQGKPVGLASGIHRPVCVSGQTFPSGSLATMTDDNSSAAPHGPGSNAPAELPCSGLRFLVAEDHDTQRHLVALFLRRLGAADVQAVRDGGEALAALTRDGAQLDIAIVDLSMPGIDGLDLLRRLAVVPHGAAFIVSSALSPATLAAMAQLARRLPIRFLGAVTKPLTRVNLEPLLAAYRQLPVAQSGPAR